MTNQSCLITYFIIYVFVCFICLVLTFKSSIHPLFFCTLCLVLSLSFNPSSLSLLSVPITPTFFLSCCANWLWEIWSPCYHPHLPPAISPNFFPLLPSLYTHLPSLPHLTLYFLPVCSSCLLVPLGVHSHGLNLVLWKLLYIPSEKERNLFSKSCSIAPILTCQDLYYVNGCT